MMQSITVNNRKRLTAFELLSVAFCMSVVS